MDPASTLPRFIAVLLLIGVNAFFVAAEFGLVAARRTRLEPLARAGDRRARRVIATLDDPDDFISAAQLGITVSTIGIGYIAEGTIYALLQPQLAALHATWGLPLGGGFTGHAVALVITLVLLAYVHVVLGEQVPRMLALHNPEAVALRVTRPTRALALLLRPLLRLMVRSASAVVRAFGVEPKPLHALPHTAEEIRLLVEQSHQEGMVETDQEKMLRGVFEFRDTLAREVMTPRRDIVALPLDAPRAEILAVVANEGHSRIPVYRESMDEIVGILLVKDLLGHIIRQTGDEAGFALDRLIREPYFVPDTKRIGELFAELRTRSVHMAVVLDEFGGTEGLVTLEDMLEEIVGDIYDEHDDPETTEFAVTAAGEVLIDGGASICDVNEQLGLDLPEQDYDTIGGFVFGELGRVPEPGDSVPLNGSGELLVDGVEDRRITRLRLLPAAPQDGAAEGAAGAASPSGGGDQADASGASPNRDLQTGA